MDKGNVESIPDLLPIYYKRLFPFPCFLKWISYGKSDSTSFKNREISFTLKEDIYVRYLSYDSTQALENDIQRKCPTKIDIGAIYSKSPRYFKKHPEFKPIEKELVFDIDMTDYDDIRKCCKGAEICLKCWRYMTIAIKIFDVALREDFGLQHLLWVFSGRRGIHCWVCDQVARKMNEVTRSCLADYFDIQIGSDLKHKRVLNSDKIHPSLRRALKIISAQFDFCVQEQDLFGSESDLKKLEQFILDEAFKSQLLNEMRKKTSSLERWNVLKDLVKHMKDRGQLPKKSLYLVEEIMLHYAYPRLDIQVSKGLNHLLKSPFCVHPKTGKICIPFNPNSAEKFDPITVPTIWDILEEIKDFDTKSNELKDIKDYKKTKIYKGVQVFNEFVRKIESYELEIRKYEEARTLNF